MSLRWIIKIESFDSLSKLRFSQFSQKSQNFRKNNNFILDVQFKYILALVNMAATVSYSCDNAESRFKVRPSDRPSLSQPQTLVILSQYCPKFK